MQNERECAPDVLAYSVRYCGKTSSICQGSNAKNFVRV
jgi:hypothetical protein